MSYETIPLEDYLKRHILEKGEEYTHTRIGDKSLKISGGSYSIKNHDEFLKSYYKSVFVDGKNEYLTERQRIEDAPLAVDIDLRYDNTVTERLHDEDDVKDFINLYVTELAKMCNIENKQKVEIFVMEKPDVNILEQKTKDGIHIIFGIGIHRAGQIYLREQVVPEIKKLWSHLPFINSEDDLIDESVTRGIANWQLYGSKKPDNQAYLIKYHYELEWSTDENKWDWKSYDIKKFNTKKNLTKLSVQYKNFPNLDFNPNIKDKIEEYKVNINKKKRKMSNKLQVKSATSIDIKQNKL